MGDWSQWDIPDCSGRLDGMDEKIISIIRNGTWSHRLLLLDHVPGHSESILILIHYSFKILLPSGSPTLIVNSTLVPHPLALYKQIFWQLVVFFRWHMDRRVLMMEMNWPQHKWRIHLHWSGLLMMTLTTCCAWQVHKQFWWFISTVCEVSEVVVGILLL